MTPPRIEPESPGGAGRPRRTGRPATMQDIADALGISQSTVSRILGGTPAPIPIKPETRQAVHDMARRLHYRPNPLARGLAGSRTNLIGVIVREIMDPFFAGTIDAITAEASGRGYNVVLGHAHGRADEVIALRAVLETRHCDAILLVGDASDQPRLVADLQETELPIVAVWQGNASPPGIPAVRLDNRIGITRLVEHLAGLGHRSLAFLGGSFSVPDDRELGDILERQAAFVEALAGLGIDVPPEYLREARNDYEGGASGFTGLMSLPNRPTAVVASTDVLATGAIGAAHCLGLAVPDDVSIVGFDDISLAEHTAPPLTTMRQPIREMAAAALSIAIDLSFQRDPAIPEPFEPILIVRESSGPAPLRP